MVEVFPYGMGTAMRWKHSHMVEALPYGGGTSIYKLIGETRSLLIAFIIVKWNKVALKY